MSGSLYFYFAMPLAHVGGSELAFQISEQFAVLGAPFNLRTAVVVGGIDMMAQALELGNRPHVVVATPGRIVDLLKSTSGEWDLSRIKFLVCAHLLASDDVMFIAHLLVRSSTKQTDCSPPLSHRSFPICSRSCPRIDRHACSQRRSLLPWSVSLRRRPSLASRNLSSIE